MKIVINGKHFDNFVEAEVTFSYDSLADTFAFKMPFDTRDKATLTALKPLAFQQVQIMSDKGTLLLTGNIVNTKFAWDAGKCMLAISGYSKTGVLENCNDTSNAGLMSSQTTDIMDTDIKDAKDYAKLLVSLGNVTEPKSDSTCYSMLTLRQFAEKMVKPFGIGVEVNPAVEDRLNQPYPMVSTDADKAIGRLIADMAFLKNVVARATPEGNLLFTQVLDTDVPRWNLSSGSPTLISTEVSVEGNNMHSEIHVLGRSHVDDHTVSGAAESIKNELVKAYRPVLVDQEKEQGALQDVTKATKAKELQGIQFEFTCANWDIIDTNEFKPGDLIRYTWFYGEVQLLIRSIRLSHDANGHRSAFTCILRQGISGENTGDVFNV